MTYSSIVYNNMCIVNKKRKTEYKKGSNLHVHHVIPKHNGGSDDESNLTYLTLREHILAHYLLYRLYKNVNDLRAMYMLGAELTSDQRRIIGEYCRDNNIGFFDQKHKQHRKMWSKKGYLSQKADYESNGTKNFYYWNTKEGKRERAKLGGIASYVSGKNEKFINMQCSFRDKNKASEAAKKSAKIPITDGIKTIKLKTEIEVEEYLRANKDWRRGTHHVQKTKGKKTNVTSPKAKKVTDGEAVFNSLLLAAQHYNVSQATIINWCRSDKKINWTYV